MHTKNMYLFWANEQINFLYVILSVSMSLYLLLIYFYFTLIYYLSLYSLHNSQKDSISCYAKLQFYFMTRTLRAKINSANHTFFHEEFLFQYYQTEDLIYRSENTSSYNAFTRRE